MLIAPDRRISLAPPPPALVAPALEAVFVGAAAAVTSYADAAPALLAAAQLGFTPSVGDTSLTDLPLAFADFAAFAAAFPGDDGWLAQAVNDYFNAGGARAWVVRVAVDPADPLGAYLPHGAPGATAAPAGIAIAAQIPSAGLLVLPDLEYLC